MNKVKINYPEIEREIYRQEKTIQDFLWKNNLATTDFYKTRKMAELGLEVTERSLNRIAAALGVAPETLILRDENI